MPIQPYEVSERLDRLEKQNRVLKRGLAGLALAVAVAFTAAAVPAGSEDAEFGAIEAKRLAITDSDGSERLILELEAGEPTLTMLNHKGDPQVYLGIDEGWDDSAYLSLSSRLEDGAVEKQALLVATPSRKKGAAGFGQVGRPGNCQLLLYDLEPQHKAAADGQLMRLSSGRLDVMKPYVEIRELKGQEARQIDFALLSAGPSVEGQRFLLDTTSDTTTISGVE